MHTGFMPRVHIQSNYHLLFNAEVMRLWHFPKSVDIEVDVEAKKMRFTPRKEITKTMNNFPLTTNTNVKFGTKLSQKTVIDLLQLWLPKQILPIAFDIPVKDISSTVPLEVQF